MRTHDHGCQEVTPEELDKACALAQGWYMSYVNQRKTWSRDGQYIIDRDDYNPTSPTESGKAQASDLQDKFGLSVWYGDGESWTVTKDTLRNGKWGAEVQVRNKSKQHAICEVVTLLGKKAEGVANYLNQPHFDATHFGLSPAEYDLWFEQGGAVTCSGYTKGKTPCKNVVASPTQLSPQQWLHLQGEYCVVHGGPNRDKVLEKISSID